MRAIFLGKFQPPHLGHIRTILKIAESYEQVIVGITMGEPKIIDYKEVLNIMREVLAGYKNINVVLIEGMIEDGTASLQDLDFDIVVSGNHKVLEALNKLGYKTIFQDRTDGLGYSGSEIRGLTQASQHVISLKEEKQNYFFKIMKVSDLKPLEKVLPSHLENIEKMLFKDGEMRRPLIVDDKYNIVLDGSHRYAFLVKYGFKYAPVISIKYDDESIFVGNHLKHRFLKDENLVISKSEVIYRGLNEKLFDARTTRHFFPFRKIDHTVSLENLIQGDQKDISYLLQNISLDEEILKDMNYISEIDDELNVLSSYVKEQEDVKAYLSYQIEEMKKKN